MRRKRAALNDIRDVVEEKLAQMFARNPMRMDYYRKYQEIIADYNREKDRVTVEETFVRLVDLANSLDAEQRRAAEEGLTDDELAMFDLLFKDQISKADRERLKQASKALLASLQETLSRAHDWTKNTTTQAQVRVVHSRQSLGVAAAAAVYRGRDGSVGESGLRLCLAAQRSWARASSEVIDTIRGVLTLSILFATKQEIAELRTRELALSVFAWKSV